MRISLLMDKMRLQEIQSVLKRLIEKQKKICNDSSFQIIRARDLYFSSF